MSIEQKLEIDSVLSSSPCWLQTDPDSKPFSPLNMDANCQSWGWNRPWISLSSLRTVHLSSWAHAVLSASVLCGQNMGSSPATKSTMPPEHAGSYARYPGLSGWPKSAFGNRSVSILCCSCCVLDVENLFWFHRLIHGTLDFAFRAGTNEDFWDGLWNEIWECSGCILPYAEVGVECCALDMGYPLQRQSLPIACDSAERWCHH